MEKNKGTGLEALVLSSQLGFTLAMPIVLGALAGHWIDSKLGTGIVFLILLLLAGLVTGIVAAYTLIVGVTKRKSKDE